MQKVTWKVTWKVTRKGARPAQCWSWRDPPATGLSHQDPPAQQGGTQGAASEVWSGAPAPRHFPHDWDAPTDLDFLKINSPDRSLCCQLNISSKLGQKKTWNSHYHLSVPLIHVIAKLLLFNSLPSISTQNGTMIILYQMHVIACVYISALKQTYMPIPKTFCFHILFSF